MSLFSRVHQPGPVCGMQKRAFYAVLPGAVPGAIDRSGSETETSL
jgi:hypothetical protein